MKKNRPAAATPTGDATTTNSGAPVPVVPGGPGGLTQLLAESSAGPKSLQPHPQPHPATQTQAQAQPPPAPRAGTSLPPLPTPVGSAAPTLLPALPQPSTSPPASGSGTRVRSKEEIGKTPPATTGGTGTGGGSAPQLGMTIQAAAAAAAYRQQQLQQQLQQQSQSTPQRGGKQLTPGQRSAPLPPPQHRTQPRGSLTRGAVATGPPSPELLKAIADRQAFYMFKFRTTYCPLFAQYKCDQAKPYTCKFAHYENHLRREPKMTPSGRWSYSASLCPHASLLECPNGPDCKNSHRMQKEHVFHPSTYKTQYCEAPFNGNYDDCVIYGPHCSKAHGPLDLRQADQLSDDEPGSARTDISSPAVGPAMPAPQFAGAPLPHQMPGEQARTSDDAGAFQPTTINITLPTESGPAAARPMPAPEFSGAASSLQSAVPPNQGAPAMPNPQRPASRGFALTAKAPEWTPGKGAMGGGFAPGGPGAAGGSRGLLTRSPGLGMRLLEGGKEPDIDRAVKELESIPQPALTPPLPTIPEQPEHEKYMYSFRVAVCEPNVPCPNDSYTCFNAHADTPRRRKPQLVHGRYNYIPTRCRYVLEDKECPQGIHCRFAHCTEEVIYHPSKYKTQICSHQTDQNGHCTGYGMHCAKAHGEEDRRIPIFECMEEGINANVTGADFDQFVCPPPERAMERQFYMYLYKTKKCEGFPWDCTCNGFDYHRAEERRRGPIIKYSPVACPNVKSYLNAEWGDPNTDACKKSVRQIKRVLPDGREEVEMEEDWECEYAHTLLELMYHPQVYKTGLCDHFDENDTARWKCVWKRRCAHAHGKSDLRSKEEAMESWREHSMLVAALQSRAAARGEAASGGEVKFIVPPGAAPQWLDGRAHTRSPAQTFGALKDAAGMSGPPPRSSPVLSTRSASSPGSPMRRAFAPPHTMRPDLFAQARALQRAASPRAAPQTLGTRVASKLASVSTSREELRSLAKVSEIEDLGRFSYNKERVLDIGLNGFKVYEGALPTGAAIGVKIIPKLAVPDLAATLADVAKLCKLGASREMHFFTRYLDMVETGDVVAIALEIDDPRTDTSIARPRIGRSLKEIVEQLKADSPSRTAHVDPAEAARLAQQMFISLFSLHRLDITHGDIGPHSVFITRTANSTAVRVADIARDVRKSGLLTSPGLTQRRMSAPAMSMRPADASAESRKRELDAAKRRDVVAASCVVYYLMSGGRFPFDLQSETESIALLDRLQDKLSVPLDTTMLEPVATHLIVNTLLTQPEQQLSAEQALRHPLFYSAMRRLHLLACVSAELSAGKSPQLQAPRKLSTSSSSPPKAHRRSVSPPHIRATGATPKMPRSASSDSLHTEGKAKPALVAPAALVAGEKPDSGKGLETASQSARLKAEIDDLSVAVLSKTGEWRAAVQPLLEHIPVRRDRSGESVTSLINFISDCLEVCCPSALPEQSDSRAAGVTSCRVHELLGLGTQHLPMCRADPSATSATPTAISEALGTYFLNTRFPALLPSVFHVVWRQWKDHSHGIFAHLLFGPFPPLLPARGAVLEPRREIAPPATVSSAVTPTTAQPVAAPAATTSQERFASRAATALQCPFGEATPHLLDDPVTTLCCGKTFCRNCLPTYLQYAANNLPNRTAGQSQGVCGRCECGRQFLPETRHELARQPVNQALGLLLHAYAQKMETDTGATSTAGPGVRHQRFPSPAAVPAATAAPQSYAPSHGTQAPPPFPMQMGGAAMYPAPPPMPSAYPSVGAAPHTMMPMQPPMTPQRMAFAGPQMPPMVPLHAQQQQQMRPPYFQPPGPPGAMVMHPAPLPPPPPHSMQHMQMQMQMPMHPYR